MKGAFGKSSRGADRVLTRVQDALGESPLYELRLRGPAPDRILATADDPYTPILGVGEGLLAGRLALGEARIDCEGELDRIWSLAEADAGAQAFLQEFAWLRHLAALGDRAAPTAKALTTAWLDRHERHSQSAWRPRFASERLMQLCAHHRLLLSGADALWRSRLLSSMARQTRHLAHVAPRANGGFERLMATLAVVVAAHCLPGCEGPAARALEMTRRELRLHVRGGRGLATRNPSLRLRFAVRMLTALRAIEKSGRAAPGYFAHVARRAGASALFFRLSDGRLAVFQGGAEDDPRALQFVGEGLAGDEGEAIAGRHADFHRFDEGRSTLLVDASGDGDFDGAGAFTYCDRGARLIGNCGAAAHARGPWGAALRGAGAHATLSAEGPGANGLRFSAARVSRAEERAGALLALTRDGAGEDGEPFRYERRLFLASGGGDLRGEETLIGAADTLADGFVWRFHLHPGLRVSLARDARSVLIAAPGGDGWIFKSNAAEMAVEKSVYCGRDRSVEPAEQIVLRARDAKTNGEGARAVKWALRRGASG